ncbi:MAG: 16S rRNA (cytosine(967)-C(5))-methyltransferase RsmB [Betaproteobacteria bacterium]|nr:16S rRNA (cytosine(967)-C(5))-methyltransferase RsmB [Betaproteobacteria bacterium]
MTRKNKANRFRSSLPPESLSFSLLGAAHIVAELENGTALPAALASVFDHPAVTPQVAGAIQDIAYRTARQLGLCRALLRLMTQKQPEPAIMRTLLYCALALLIEPDDKSRLPYEPYTTVDQSVTAAASTPLFSRSKGLVNAVLRRFLREQEILLAHAREKTEATWNYPDWWVRAMQSAYPENWEAILKAGNTMPPLTLRVNQKKLTTNDYLTRLFQADMDAVQIGPHAIMLATPVPVSQIPGFNEGLVSVQDAAAQLAAPLLDLHDGMRVLDACAAPGGKTGHILETADVKVTALDNDAKRLERVRENMQRLQLQANVKQGNATRQDWWDGTLFDRILADVPCTASGIVRRHPDIRWLRRETDLNQLATFSAQILDNLWQMLRPDGKLLLVTCSIWPAESEMQAVAFASKHRAVRLPAPGQLLPITGQDKNHDGLFYALFQKTAS